MRLVSYSRKGYVRLGALLERQVVDLPLAYQVYCRRGRMPADLEGCFASMKALFSAGPEALKVTHETVHFAARTLGKESLPGFWHPLDQVRILAPLSNPGKVICIGGNYPAAGKLSAPEFPTVFLKPASTITGPGMPVHIPAIASSVSYEVELAVVIGKRGHNIAEADVASYIAGYTLANDIGDRLLEKRTSQWTSGKMFDSFTPLGPVLLTPDEMSDTHSLRMQTRINDQQVQTGNTCEMFFDVDQLVRYISTLTTLEPGDLVLTGSPKLVDGQPGPALALKPGDTVLVGIDCLGELVNPVREEA
jgi:acylpyruvate hydrolase